MAWLTRAQAAAMSEEERIDYLTKTVIGEAVGEGEIGMAVVAQVIANRSGDARWPSDPVAVAGQKFQFSTNNPFGYEGGNEDMVRKYGPNTIQYQQARAAVQAAIIDKSLPDITGNAKYYHTSAMGYPSSWGSSIKKNGWVDVGGHRLYPDRPVAVGEIPANIAKVQQFGVGTMLSVQQAALAPIRPAKLSASLTLQREVNRVAGQRANAKTTIRTARALAFSAVADPFDMARPARGSDPIINRPQPAMRSSMQSRLKATGTPTTTERTFAQMNRDASMDGDGTLRVSTAALRTKAPPVAAAPWGVRETVAAAVAAADAEAGRGQLVMDGNPNAARSVVSWLYPAIKEGEGEGNQVGKGPRAVAAKQAQSAGANRQAQADEQRDQPRVVVQNGRARVVTEAATLQDAIIRESMDKANAAESSPGAAALATQIAARRVAANTRTIRTANQAAAPVARPAMTAAAQRVAADTRTMREANQNAKPAVASAVTAASTKTAADVRTLQAANQAASAKAATPTAARSTPVNEARLPTGSAVITPMATPAARPASRAAPTQLPAIRSAQTDPIGSMPRLGDLAALRSDPLQPTARTAITTTAKPVTPKPAAQAVPAPAVRPAAPAAPKVSAAVVKPTTVAPVTGRPVVVRPPAAAVVKPAAPARKPLEIVVSGSNTVQPMSAVDRLRAQGLSPSEAYTEANSQARKRAESNSTSGVSTSGRRYDAGTNTWSDGSGRKTSSSKSGGGGAPDSLSS